VFVPLINASNDHSAILSDYIRTKEGAANVLFDNILTIIHRQFLLQLTLLYSILDHEGVEGRVPDTCAEMKGDRGYMRTVRRAEVVAESGTEVGGMFVNVV
jgi:hypothetical protein